MRQRPKLGREPEKRQQAIRLKPALVAGEIGDHDGRQPAALAVEAGKLKLILSGFAEAALAAHAIHPLVHPGEALHFEYSTTKGVPGS